MAKNQEIDLSTTAASNTDVIGVNIDEGMARTDVNQALRAIAKLRADAITRHVTKAAGTYTAAKTDHNQFWRCTGAVEIDLTAAATLTSGWCLWIRANGGAVTIDPNGTENIDGASTSIVLPDGQSAVIVCTGTEFFLMMRGWNTQKTPTQQVFTGSGTWTRPAGCKTVLIEAVGAGGGGGGVDGQGAGTFAGGAGGGSGAYGFSTLLDVSAIGSSTITIPAGGAAGASGNNAGTAGTGTIWADGTNTLTWGGGGGGSGMLAASVSTLTIGGAAGVGTNVVAAGNVGTGGFRGSLGAGGSGASSPFGAGGLGQLATTTAVAGNAGGGYGAGGGGASSGDTLNNTAGGAGSGGYMRVYEFY